MGIRGQTAERQKEMEGSGVSCGVVRGPGVFWKVNWLISRT